MAEPVSFDIKVCDHLWRLTRDGEPVHSFSHVDRATHEAVRLARELDESGQPARVRVHAAEGKVIEVTLDPPAEQPPEDLQNDHSALDRTR
jgi:hypothetical protein